MDTARPALHARASVINELHAAGVVLFVLAALFLTVIMLAASMAPGYDITGGAISDLGVVEETAFVFNVSLILVGMLNISGGWLFSRAHRRGLVLAPFVIAGIGAIGAGLFPLNSGGLHGLFALAAFVAFNIEAIAVGTVVTGPMRPLSLLAGVVGIVFVALMVVGDSGNAAAFGPIGHGGIERMIVYPSMLWMLALAGSLMAAREDGAMIVRQPGSAF